MNYLTTCPRTSSSAFFVGIIISPLPAVGMNHKLIMFFFLSCAPVVPCVCPNRESVVLPWAKYHATQSATSSLVRSEYWHCLSLVETMLWSVPAAVIEYVIASCPPQLIQPTLLCLADGPPAVKAQTCCPRRSSILGCGGKERHQHGHPNHPRLLPVRTCFPACSRSAADLGTTHWRIAIAELGISRRIVFPTETAAARLQRHDRMAPHIPHASRSNCRSLSP